DGRLYGKPANAAEAEEMLDSLAGKTHEVVSGLALLTPAWEEVHREVTLVTFRRLDARDLAHYVASAEWEGRAGGYAIQGLGASLVERIEGDYLNVVGLPAARLVRLLAERFPCVYGFGCFVATSSRKAGSWLDSASRWVSWATSTVSAAATWPSTSEPRTRWSTCAGAASCSRSRAWSRSTSAAARCMRSASRPSACSDGRPGRSP